MKNHTEIAEKLNGKSIIRAAGEALRGRANCRIGVERESLRCTASGELAETAHPETLGRKDDNPFFTADWAESQIELKTPPCESPLDALLGGIVPQGLTTGQTDFAYIVTGAAIFGNDNIFVAAGNADTDGKAGAVKQTFQHGAAPIFRGGRLGALGFDVG